MASTHEAYLRRRPQSRDECAAYYKKNRTSIRAKAKEFAKANPAIVREWQRSYREKKKTSINWMLANRLRSRIWSAIKYNKRGGSAVRDLGCTLDQLKAHLSARFTDGMSWSNYGEWHIDHIRPLKTFNLSDRQQFLEAVHYTNLQPLWASENASKGAKLHVTTD